jgi:hypothetical protein
MGVLARILLRYGTGFLIAHGWLTDDLGNQLALDPEIASYLEIAMGAAVLMLTEGWYWLAKRYGWTT